MEFGHFLQDVKMNVCWIGGQLEIVIAGKSFDHHCRSIHTEGLMYWNYHVRRFRPVGSTAWLMSTDWAIAKERHGNVGRQTAINFIEVQPRLEP